MTYVSASNDIHVDIQKGQSMNIIEMAEQAGMHSPDGFKLTVNHMAVSQLEKFAELVAAHDREECAKLFESIQKDSTVPPVHFSLSDTAKIIRARGKA